jgi:AraC-like DNA-binding protein
MHAGSVACLAVGIDDAFVVETAAGTLRTRSALIEARTRHQFVAPGAGMAFSYLDPGSVREEACRRSMSKLDAGVRHGHEREDELTRLAANLRATREDANRWRALAAPVTPGHVDPRVQTAARRLVQDPTEARGAPEFARDAGLSLSRFLHLFSDQTGTTFRRYRLWAKMLRAGTVLAAGHDLTTAAVEAGFSSSSHFSSSFHATFGLRPSQLIAAGLTIVIAT